MNNNQISSPESVLVRLKDKISLAMGIDIHKLKMLIDRHTLRSFNGVTTTKTHYDKVNTYKSLTDSRLTIKVFFRFLAILGVRKVRFTIDIETDRGTKVTVFDDITFAGEHTGERDEKS